jgi:hypothetical protein
MNRKLISIILTVVMAVTMLAGCSVGKSEPSTYFGELKELKEIKTGTANIEMSLTATVEDFKKTIGGDNVKLKFDVVQESARKVGATIAIKLGDRDYIDFTTLVLDGNKLYVDAAKAVDAISQINAEAGQKAKEALGQMGINGAVSLDLAKVLEALNMKMPEEDGDVQKSVEELADKMIEALEKNFADLQGKGDSYCTFTVNGDNADKAVDGLVNFLKNDSESIIGKYMDIMKSVLGSDNEMASTVEESFGQIKNQIPDAAKKVEEGKEDFVKAIKDNNINVVSKLNVDGGEAEFSLETGDIEVENEKANFSITANVKEGKASIEKMIPEDASDITSMLVLGLSQMQKNLDGLGDITDDGGDVIEE